MSRAWETGHNETPCLHKRSIIFIRNSRLRVLPTLPLVDGGAAKHISRTPVLQLEGSLYQLMKLVAPIWLVSPPGLTPTLGATRAKSRAGEEGQDIRPPPGSSKRTSLMVQLAAWFKWRKSAWYSYKNGDVGQGPQRNINKTKKAEGEGTS